MKLEYFSVTEAIPKVLTGRLEVNLLCVYNEKEKVQTISNEDDLHITNLSKKHLDKVGKSTEMVTFYFFYIQWKFHKSKTRVCP